MDPEWIDFDRPIPYYVQLIEILKNKINQKVWKPGDKIPGEPELCSEYGVSRTVVRQALLELEQEDLIVRRKGKGTFIAYPKIGESLANKLTGFYQDMVARGLVPETQVLHQRIIPATDELSGYLEIPPGTPVIDIKRLRSVNQEPIQLVTSFIPYELCPRACRVDLTNRSLYEFLEEDCGLKIARGRRFIEAVAAGDEEAKLLRVRRGAPLVMLNSICYLQKGIPIEYYISLHRGDRTRFDIELVRVRETAR